MDDITLGRKAINEQTVVGRRYMIWDPRTKPLQPPIEVTLIGFGSHPAEVVVMGPNGRRVKYHREFLWDCIDKENV